MQRWHVSSIEGAKTSETRTRRLQESMERFANTGVDSLALAAIAPLLS
jgi:hypothetical protein